MKKTIALVVIVILASVPAAAQKVDIHYAHEFDFGTISTFQYVDTENNQVKSNEIMIRRIESMIKKELREGGLSEVDEDPDIFVTFHIITEEKSSYTTTGWGYGGYWGGWYGWGGYPGISTTTINEYSYEVGTLVIDAYDGVEKKMLWRGTGTVKVKDKPQKQTQQIEKILAKLGKKWDKILVNKGK